MKNILLIFMLINDRVRITKYKSFFSKDYTEYWSREIFIIDSVLKTNLCICKLKGLNARKIIKSFYQKIVVEYITKGLLPRTRQSH